MSPGNSRQREILTGPLLLADECGYLSQSRSLELERVMKRLQPRPGALLTLSR